MSELWLGIVYGSAATLLVLLFLKWVFYRVLPAILNIIEEWYM